MQDNLEGLCVGGQNDEICHTSVEGFSRLVGSLLQQLEVLGLGQQVNQLLVQGVVGLRVGSGKRLAVVFLVSFGIRGFYDRNLYI